MKTEQMEAAKKELREKAIKDLSQMVDFLPESTQKLIQTAWMMGYMKAKMEASEL